MNPFPRQTASPWQRALLVHSLLVLAAVANAAPDTVAPSPISASPPDGATAVSRTTPVSATFDEPLDISAIAGSALALTCDGTDIPGAVSAPGNPANQLIFTPASPLPAWRYCTARIPVAAIRDAAGNGNAAAFTWTFRTVKKTRQLTLLKDGAGSGSVIGAGSLPPASGSLSIDCGSRCTATVLAGNDYVLEAAAAPGSDFARWIGCPEPDGRRCRIPVMDRDRQVTARFRPAALPASLSFRTIQTSVSTNFYAVAYGKGVLVAGGQGRQDSSTPEGIKGDYTLMHSTDQGETWQHASPLQPLNDSVNPRDSHFLWVDFNGTQFLAFDRAYGDPFISVDGIHWTRGNRPNLAGGPSAMAWCGNRYVVLTRDNDYATSPDGLNWSIHTGPLDPAGQTMSTTCLPGGDLLVAAKYIREPTANALWKLHADGRTWSALDHPKTLARTSTVEPGTNRVGFEAMASRPDGRVIASPRYDGNLQTAGMLIGTGPGLPDWFRADEVPQFPNRIAWTGDFFEATRFDGATTRSSHGYHWTPMQPTGIAVTDLFGDGGIPFVRIGNRLIVVGTQGRIAIGTP